MGTQAGEEGKATKPGFCLFCVIISDVLSEVVTQEMQWLACTK